MKSVCPRPVGLVGESGASIDTRSCIAALELSGLHAWDVRRECVCACNGQRTLWHASYASSSDNVDQYLLLDRWSSWRCTCWDRGIKMGMFLVPKILPFPHPTISINPSNTFKLPSPKQTTSINMGCSDCSNDSCNCAQGSCTCSVSTLTHVDDDHEIDAQS